MRTLIPLACATWLVALCPCWAGEHEQRFLEFPGDNDTLTFDLSTVQMIQPGRFTIISTSIDNPDVMQLKLKALDTMRTYCSHPDGKYPFPPDLLTLGPADMPVKSIEVKNRIVLLRYPYKRLSLDAKEEWPEFLSCRREHEKTELDLYFEQRAMITNGFQRKQLFDCKRGLTGRFMYENDDPSKAFTKMVRPYTNGETYYLSVCYAVTHEWPYLPEPSASAQADIASRYQFGLGVKQDYAEAAKWYRKAAEQGSVDAQNILGFAYEMGQGVQQDYSEAAKWYRLAADQGDGNGQLSIGISYYTGKGVPQDYVQAYKWFTLALAHFPESETDGLTNMMHNNCIQWRDKVAPQMTSTQIAEAQRQVSAWRPTRSGKQQPAAPTK